MMAADGDDGNDNDGGGVGMGLFMVRTPVPHADDSGVEG